MSIEKTSENIINRKCLDFEIFSLVCISFDIGD